MRYHGTFDNVPVYTILYFCLASVLGVASFSVKISPDNIQKLPLSNISVQCITEPAEPISACQFRIWYVGRQKQGILMNVPDSEDTKIITVPNPDGDDNYTAYLDGGADRFNSGFCNLKLSNVRGERLMIGCKLTSVSELSEVKTMPVFFHNGSFLHLVNHTEMFLVERGKNLSFLLETDLGIKLSGCLFKPEQVPVEARHDRKNGPKYYNDGKVFVPWTSSGRELTSSRYARSQCSIAISNVQEENNGVFFVVAYGEDPERASAKAVTLVVTGSIRGRVSMSVSSEAHSYYVGDTLTFTCTAHRVRQPLINWRWTWRNPATNSSECVPKKHFAGQSVEGWSWPWEEAVISHSMTLTLERHHRGKYIQCHAENMIDAGLNLIEKKIIDIQQKPPSETTAPQPPSTISPSSESSQTTQVSRPAPTTVYEERTEPTEPVDADDSVEGTFIDKWLLIAIVTALVLFVVLVNVAVCALVTFLKKLDCFKGRRQRPAPEPQYIEINAELMVPPATLQPKPLPPIPPLRNKMTNDYQRPVPAERALGKPKICRDSVVSDGYVKPIEKK